MAADRALLIALPGLVEGLDDVDAETSRCLPRASTSWSDARLVRRRRQRACAHAAGARPADLADHDLLAGELRGHLLADRMRHGSPRARAAIG